MLSMRHLWFGAMLVLSMSAVSAHAETIQVTIAEMAFSPAEISARVGDTIEWVNKDILAHTATVTGGWEVMIPPNRSASIVLEKAGVVDYYCRFHPNMKGRITAAVR
ncbi:cupredoxin family copper-binding protein [Mesorhizobium sp. KR1-2]|uniref:cupredoxin domain-containing protein n=1 Tax=Mesorhizobium sp. KR1-2 TaxID=3156609 RepID=UPI0032B5CFC5